MIFVTLMIAAVIAAAGAWMLFQLRRLRMLASAMLAASGASVFALAISALSGSVFRTYGWTLFVLLPVAMGFLAVLIFGQDRPVELREVILVSLLTLAVSAVGLLFLGIEGLICLAMALPLAAPLVVVGGLLGRALLRRPRTASHATLTMLVVAGLIPGAGNYERNHPRPAPVFAVTTAIDIAAPSETVWRATIAPSQLAAPDEWIFRLGIAYPRAAHIDGSGLGATRYCNFSTGDLVEPVLTWDEPRLLRFAVTSNPEPMVEMSPYHNIHPSHLKGFLVSRQGQFRL